LVHGTFARKTTWIDVDSAFSAGLLEYFPESTIHPFRWSGKNSARTRQNATKSLVVFVRELSARYAGQEVVLVGHSHGGSIILKASHELRENGICVKIACLGTPFLRYFKVDLLPSARVLASGVISILGILFFLSVSSEAFGSAAEVIGTYPDRGINEYTGLPNDNPQEMYAYMGGFMAAVFLLLGLLWLSPVLFLSSILASVPLYFILKRIQDAWLRKNLETNEALDCLAIYTETDEAWRWLDFIQSCFGKLYSILELAGAYLWKIVLISSLVGAISWATSYLGFESSFMFFGVPLASGLLHVVSTIVALSTLPLTLLIALLSGSPVGYGAAGLLGLQIVGASTSQVPWRGSNSLRTAKVKIESSGPFSLAHSGFQDHDGVIQTIAQWLNGMLPQEARLPKVERSIQKRSPTSRQWKQVIVSMAILYAALILLSMT
jgi:pimeloyl-ACP methyl ester carboxylesterase